MQRQQPTPTDKALLDEVIALLQSDEDSPEKLQALIAKGFDLNTIWESKAQYFYCKNLKPLNILYHAIENNKRNIIKFLLTKDNHHTDLFALGFNALHAAVALNRVEIVKLLVEYNQSRKSHLNSPIAESALDLMKYHYSVNELEFKYAHLLSNSLVEVNTKATDSKSNHDSLRILKIILLSGSQKNASWLKYDQEKTIEEKAYPDHRHPLLILQVLSTTDKSQDKKFTESYIKMAETILNNFKTFNYIKKHLDQFFEKYHFAETKAFKASLEKNDELYKATIDDISEKEAIYAQKSVIETFTSSLSKEHAKARKELSNILKMFPLEVAPTSAPTFNIPAAWRDAYNIRLKDIWNKYLNQSAYNELFLIFFQNALSLLNEASSKKEKLNESKSSSKLKKVFLEKLFKTELTPELGKKLIALLGELEKATALKKTELETQTTVEVVTESVKPPKETLVKKDEEKIDSHKEASLALIAIFTDEIALFDKKFEEYKKQFHKLPDDTEDSEKEKKLSPHIMWREINALKYKNNEDISQEDIQKIKKYTEILEKDILRINSINKHKTPKNVKPEPKKKNVKTTPPIKKQHFKSEKEEKKETHIKKPTTQVAKSKENPAPKKQKSLPMSFDKPVTTALQPDRKSSGLIFTLGDLIEIHEKLFDEWNEELMADKPTVKSASLTADERWLLEFIFKVFLLHLGFFLKKCKNIHNDSFRDTVLYDLFSKTNNYEDSEEMSKVHKTLWKALKEHYGRNVDITLQEPKTPPSTTPDSELLNKLINQKSLLELLDKKKQGKRIFDKANNILIAENLSKLDSTNVLDNTSAFSTEIKAFAKKALVELQRTFAYKTKQTNKTATSAFYLGRDEYKETLIFRHPYASNLSNSTEKEKPAPAATPATSGIFSKKTVDPTIQSKLDADTPAVRAKS